MKKVQLLDVAFLVIFIATLAFFVLYFWRKPSTINITIKVTDNQIFYARNDPSNEYALSFIEGDVEKNELGLTTAEIIGVRSYPISSEEIVTYLNLEVKAIYNPRKNIYTLKGKPVVFGEPFSFVFQNTRVEGLVADFPGFADRLNAVDDVVIIEAQFREDSRAYSDTFGVPEYKANAVKVGDKIIDTSGEVLVEVMDIKITPATRTVLSSSGQLLVTADPLLKDVFYTLKLKVKKINGKLYAYDFYAIDVSRTMPLNFPHVVIYPTITQVY